MNDRWTVLGLASVRAPWFRQTTGWAMAGVLPLDFIKCVSAEELVARLDSGRAHSAVIVDADLPGVDRDLVLAARSRGVAVLLVAGPSHRLDLEALGASIALEPDFSRGDLIDALRSHAATIDTPGLDASAMSATPRSRERSAPAGKLIAVTGRTGSGVSTASIALAQGFGRQAEFGGQVVLADLAREADLALLHDAHDVVPGVQELVEAHRSADPSMEQVRAMTFHVAARRYDLLLGLRRPRDWISLRRNAFDAALAGLRRAYGLVVADVDADFEGNEHSGSNDVEDRNHPARRAVQDADVVVAVGTATLVGLRSLVRLLAELDALGVPGERIQPVISRGPTRQRDRADLARTLADLIADDQRVALPSPIHLPERRHLDDAHRNGAALPAQLTAPLTGAVAALIERPVEPVSSSDDLVPELVAPGSLGLAGADWSGDEGAAEDIA